MSAFGAYLQAGGGRGVAVHPTPGSRVVQQVLFMGQTLIELHQVAHMDQLLALSGTAADTLGAAFLKVNLPWHCPVPVHGLLRSLGTHA